MVWFGLVFYQKKPKNIQLLSHACVIFANEFFIVLNLNNNCFAIN